MQHKRRDLLVCLNNDHRTPQEVDHEVEALHQMLLHVETLENFCIAHEVIDLNRYKVLRQPHHVQNAVLRRDFRSFEFICNKN